MAGNALTPHRVIRRQAKLLSHDVIDVARTALIVVDMQNYFAAEGFPLEVPMARLRGRGVENLLITGTVTNVCCESTARDAMMLDYRVIMVADGNASLTDEEHAATLNNFLCVFGDVMPTDEAIARLVPTEARRSA